MSSATLHIGDVRDVMGTMADGSVDLILTSPPFLALRSYLPGVTLAGIAWDGAATVTPPKWSRTTGTGESAVLWAVYDTPDPAVSGGGWRVGAIHMVDGTWRTLSRSAGLGGRWRRAKDAPPWAQDAVAWWAITHGGRSHWSGTGCW